MINIQEKENCVGCNGCKQKCPVQCISMEYDEQGFLYPHIDLTKCIDCGLCERVCPVINQGRKRSPLASYAAQNNLKEELEQSSSGGVFSLLAKDIINNGGVVFGARFDENWDVIHDYADTVENIKYFQGSKYVQSNIVDTFLKVERFLKDGRRVMFTGTPCQIVGLKLFLVRDYGERLLLVEIACHSVPSPKLWQNYIRSIKIGEFDDINFRDKKEGWRRYGFSISKNTKRLFYQKAGKNTFMSGFVADLFSRPSCFCCPAKEGKSQSDITLADFWGIWEILPSLNCSDGVSAVIVNTVIGENAIKNIAKNLTLERVEYEKLVKFNSALIKSAKKPKQYAEFWAQYVHAGFACVEDFIKKMKPNFLQRVLNFLRRKINIK